MLEVVSVSVKIRIEDYGIQVRNAIKDAAIAFLHEAGGELEAQTKRNCRVKTGKTKGSFTNIVDESAYEVIVGSDYQNAIWEELGTGIYAANGDGRKDVPWRYQDASGQWHTTFGKKPQHMLQKAFDSTQGKIKAIAEERFGKL